MNMICHALKVIIVFLYMYRNCFCQTPIYYCNFNLGLVDTCDFKGAFDLFTTTGVNPSASKPIQPLSDITSIQSLTFLEKELCKLPYNNPSGNWSMHFCRQNSPNNYTCPIESGTGHCIVGKYVYLRSTGTFDHTYLITIQTKSENQYCLDFYYYLTNTANNVAISFGWMTDVEKEMIVEVIEKPDNKWENSRTTYRSPSSEIYQIWFRMRRAGGTTAVFHALDEIKIYEGVCDAASTTSLTEMTTITIDNSQLYSIPMDSTTTKTDTSTAVSPDTSDQSLSLSEEPSTSTTTIIQVVTATTYSTGDNWQSTIYTPIIDEKTSVDASAETTTISTKISSSTITSHSEASEPITTITLKTTTITSKPDTTSVFITSTSTNTFTSESITPIFTCDFSIDLCFGDDHLVITNGTEFTPTDSNEPPLAPISDVTSISEPTSNNEKCKLPYRLSTNNHLKTNEHDMWFCYENQCLTENGELAICAPGNYGLITITPWKSNKTSISRNIITRGSVGEQCLCYYYYFTVYDYVQRFSILIRPNNQTGNEFEIDRLTIAEMTENRWHRRNITFNSTITNYSLILHFEVGPVNQIGKASLNKTIYFALDNIQLYDYNCSYVFDHTLDPTTTRTAFSHGAVLDQSSKSNTLGLILGLPLGIGIPVLILIIGIRLFYVRKDKHRYLDVDRFNIPMRTIDIKSDNDIFTDSNVF